MADISFLIQKPFTATDLCVKYENRLPLVLTRSNSSHFTSEGDISEMT